MSKFSKKANDVRDSPVVHSDDGLVAVIDLDFVKYSSAAVGEKRSIVVTHKTTGRSKEFNNRTEFWGRKKDRSEGWLGELNKSRESPFLPEEFEIEDIQKVDEPIENILHSAKLVVEGALSKLGTKHYKAYMGEGQSFRVDLSTLMEYKGNRTDLAKPLLLDDVTEYLRKKFKPEIVTGIECDDRCVMEAYGKGNHVVVGVDKDFMGSPIKVFNPNKPDDGIIDCRGLGSLWRDGKGKVRGKGALFWLFLCTSQDSIDNYKANCFSDIKWGEVKAYEALKDCKSYKEAFQSAVNTFKHLYPEPKIITGWRGDEIEINWLYVLQEMVTMSWLHRWEDDYLVVKEILDKLEIKYE